MSEIDRMTRLRVLVLTLIATVVMVAAGVIVIRVTGHDIGEPCNDSYSCADFLTGGECLDIGVEAYCSQYCDTDDDCPTKWTCEGANPTVLGVETSAVDEICVRPPARRGGK
jgi:hypothetical protein